MANRNFAVATSNEVVNKGNAVLKRLAKPDERKGETLSRAFDILNAYLDGEVIQSGGVDVEALDASLANIRNQFLAMISGNKEIIAKKDARIDELKQSVVEAEAAVKQAQEAASEAREEAEKCREELVQANGTAKLIDTFSPRLAEAEETQKLYSELQQKALTLEALVDSLSEKLDAQEGDFRHQIQMMRKDHETEIQKLKAQMDRSVSDAKKDAALEKEKALADKEREMNAQTAERIHELERENIRLQMENDTLKGCGTGRRSDRKSVPSKRTLGEIQGADQPLMIEKAVRGNTVINEQC